jgi:hypothetical protein
MLLAICMASGKPFLGRATRQGRVLYCDAETSMADLQQVIASISKFLGLERVPDDFLLWSPNWESAVCPLAGVQLPSTRLIEQVGFVRPQLVIADALRTFWPSAEIRSDEAMQMIQSLRRFPDISWVIPHHRRKPGIEGAVRLQDEPRKWFLDAAGSHALINNSDVRLGLEEVRGPGDAELILSGFARGRGPFEPLYLARVYDPDMGDPLGYHALRDIQLLPENFRDALNRLAPTFRFKDAHAALGGNSYSNTNRMLKQCESLGLIEKKNGFYIKLSALSGVDGVSGASSNLEEAVA